MIILTYKRSIPAMPSALPTELPRYVVERFHDGAEKEAEQAAKSAAGHGHSEIYLSRVFAHAKAVTSVVLDAME